VGIAVGGFSVVVGAQHGGAEVTAYRSIDRPARDDKWRGARAPACKPAGQLDSRARGD
jgi:hypothetical protein